MDMELKEKLYKWLKLELAYSLYWSEEYIEEDRDWKHILWEYIFHFDEWKVYGISKNERFWESVYKKDYLIRGDYYSEKESNTILDNLLSKFILPKDEDIILMYLLMKKWK